MNIPLNRKFLDTEKHLLIKNQIDDASVAGAPKNYYSILILQDMITFHRFSSWTTSFVINKTENINVSCYGCLLKEMILAEEFDVNDGWNTSTTKHPFYSKIIWHTLSAFKGAFFHLFLYHFIFQE